MNKIFTFLIYIFCSFTLVNCSTQTNSIKTTKKFQPLDFKNIASYFNKNYILVGYFKCDDLNIRVESTGDKSDLKYFIKLEDPEEIAFFSSQKFYLNTYFNAKLFVKKGKYYIERLAKERKLLGMIYPRRNTIYEVNFTNNDLVLRNLNTKEYCNKYEIIE